MKVAIGCDHTGVFLKTKIIGALIDRGFKVTDFGTYSAESADYADFAHPVAKGVQDNEFEKGIVICGSGNGVSMTVNKYPAIRAALCWNVEIARLARLHNDANILALPARFIDVDVALEAVKVFFETDFENGRHSRRINKIPKLLS